MPENKYTDDDIKTLRKCFIVMGIGLGVSALAGVVGNVMLFIKLFTQ